MNQNSLEFTLSSNRKRRSVQIEYDEHKRIIELGVQGIKVDLLLVQEKQTNTLGKVFFLPAMEKQGFSLQNVQIFLPDENQYTYHYKTTWYFRSGEIVEDPLKETDHSFIFLNEPSKNIIPETGQKKE